MKLLQKYVSSWDSKVSMDYYPLGTEGGAQFAYGGSQCQALLKYKCNAYFCLRVLSAYVEGNVNIELAPTFISVLKRIATFFCASTCLYIAQKDIYKYVHFKYQSATVRLLWISFMHLVQKAHTEGEK